MPNWCSTTYAFYGPDIQRFKSILEETFADKKSKSKYSVCKRFGIDPLKVECRGSIECFWFDEKRDAVFVETEDAWGADTDFWKAMINYNRLDIKYDFIATESGCEYFVVTDKTGKYFPIRYAIDYCCLKDCEKLGLKANMDDVFYFPCKEDLLEWIMFNQVIHYTKITPITYEEVKEFCKNYDETQFEFLTLREYEVIDVE